MPLPFILGAAAVTAIGYGAKKGYDGYQDKELAESITNEAKRDYNKAKSVFDEQNQKTTDALEKLGNLQLQIGTDFGEFRRIADELLAKLNQSKHGKNLKIAIPAHKLNAIKNLELSTVAYLGKMVGGGVAGAAAAYAVYGGVMMLGAASTGTSIAALSGAAAYNATMAAIGGGSIAAGGFGMAGGAAILGGVVAAPIVAIAGWAYASHAEEALEHARETRKQVDNAIEKMALAKAQFEKTRHYVEKIYQGTNNLYTIFTKYFHELKSMNQLIEDGGDVNSVEANIIQSIENGYAVAAILTDIITTPLFKPKIDDQGNVILDDNQAVVIETDADGLQVLNEDAINNALKKADDDIEPLAE